MGEYVKVRGEEFKIGTCEDLYYCTFPQFVEWLKLGILSQIPGNLPPREYITSEAFRFRFPFPNEARDAEGYPKDHDHGVTVHLPDKWVEFDHHDVWVSMSPRSGGYNVNVAVPCPNSGGLEAKGLQHSPVPSGMLIDVVQQRPLEGKLWTVIRCSYCGALVRLTVEEALRVAEFLETDRGYGGRREDEGDWWHKVASIVRSGYAPENAYAQWASAPKGRNGNGKRSK